MLFFEGSNELLFFGSSSFDDKEFLFVLFDLSFSEIVGFDVVYPLDTAGKLLLKKLYNEFFERSSVIGIGGEKNDTVGSIVVKGRCIWRSIA